MPSNPEPSIALQPGDGGRSIATLLGRDADPNHPIVQVIRTLKYGDHLLVSAASSPARNKFVGAFMQHTATDLLVVAAGELSDLKVPHAKCLRLGPDSSPLDHDAAIAREANSGPAILLAGEISDTNASFLWEAARSGKAHLVATISATRCNDAINSFIQRVNHSLLEDDPARERTRSEMRSRIRVIQVDLIGEKLRITTIR